MLLTLFADDEKISQQVNVGYCVHVNLHFYISTFQLKITLQTQP